MHLGRLGCCFVLVSLLRVGAIPLNDNFVDRIHLSGVPVLTNGSNAQATREPGDPTTVGGGICNATVWWSWTAPSNGHYSAVVITEAPAYPLVDIFRGSTATGLIRVANWDGRTPYPLLRNGTNCQATQVTFDAIAGIEYEIIVGTEYPNEVPYELAVTVPPTISYFTPTNDTDFPIGSDILLGIGANDTDGTISSANYSIRFGPLIAVSTNSPWSVIWTNAPVGRYTLIARAIDDLGASATVQHEITIGRPPNDNFANRILLPGSPVSTEGPISAAGKEMGEPSAIGYYTSSRTIWWSWVAPSDGRYAAVASATNIVTVGVYTGTNVSNLALQAFSEESHEALINGQYRFCRQAEWDAVAGTEYQICVDGPSSDVGLAITRPPHVTINHPADGSVFASPVGISISAVALDPDGTMQRLDLYEIHTGPGYGWSVPVARLTNSPWDFTWNTGSTGNYPLGVRGIDNLGAVTSSSNRIWVAVARPPNDDFAQRIVIPNRQTNTTVTGSNTWSTAETGESYGRSSVWWSWTAPATGPAIIDTCGSFEGAYLKLFTGSSISNLSPFGSAAGSICASLPFTAIAGTTYHIAVEGNWAQGHIQLNIFSPPFSRVWFGNPAFQADGKVRLHAMGVPGQRSILEAATNLTDWLPIATNEYTGAELQFVDPEAQQFQRRFYRILQR